MRPLGAAADYCRKLTQRSQSSFYFAFFFLERERRDALYALYAFCRLVDDAVDEAPSPAEALERLGAWRRELASVYGAGTPTHPVARRLKQTIARFPLRREDLAAVIEGCQWDLERARYATWEELEGYCHRVASAVGLACVEIFGARSPRARDYARDLGVALQLTNILRDVDEDARRGRIYLPQEDLAAFGVREADVLAGRRSAELVRLLHFEAQRARGHYFRARAAIAEDERARLVVAEIMADIYSALLEDLARRDFPAGPRATLGRRRKAGIALARYARTRLGEQLRRATRRLISAGAS